MIDLAQDAGVVADKESVGGGNKFAAWDSNVYNCIVDTAYLEQAQSKAIGMVVIFKDPDTDKTMKETFWIKSGDAKGNKTYYLDKKKKDDAGNPIKHPLPGYTSAERLCMAAIGENLNDAAQKVEKKTLNIFDWGQRKDVPQERPVFTELMGKPVKVAMSKIKEFKRKKNESTGVYEDTAETREINETRLFFDPKSSLSAEEKAEGATEAARMQEWLDNNEGEVIDKTDGAKPADTPAATVVEAPAQDSASSLFG